MIFKKDNFIFGLALGFIAPMIGFLIYKLIKFKSLSFSEMLQWMKLNPNLITVSISVSLMANAILFTIYVNGYRDKTAKGIFIVTMIYAIIALAFKFW
jgi:multisubunit Na+/H+ antiporter MnhC subunit